MSVKRKVEAYTNMFSWMTRETNMIRFMIAIAGYTSIVYIENSVISGFGLNVPSKFGLAIFFSLLFILAPDLSTLLRKRLERE
jgi:hypothetical protein